MTNTISKKTIVVIISLIIAFLSIFVLSDYASSPKSHKKTIASLDDKKTTVMELAAASTAASAAITLIPGDAATPIAEKLADLSSYFLLVLCAIYLEKYLVTITGYATFTILIPAACILFSVSVFSKSNAWRNLAKKLGVFGLAIVLVIPASVKVADMIEQTYNSSIEKTMEDAKQITEDVKESTKKEKEGVLSGIVSGVKDGVAEISSKIENVLNNFIEALAVMIVTSCVIPIVVLLFFAWLVKSILGVNINLPKKII